MSNRPQVEEVSDSDPEIDDPSSFLPSNSNTLISPANIPSLSTADSDDSDDENNTTTIPPSANSLFGRQAQLQAMHGPGGSAAQQEMLQPQGPGTNMARDSAQERAAKEAIKTFQSLYPVYFDASKTRQEGRRVSAKFAVKNPLAREIVEAVSSIVGAMPNVRIAFEPDKIHPKDWSNPGRVRVQLREKETGKWLVGSKVQNKAHLYILVGEWLQKHPATPETPLNLKIARMPVPEKIDPPAVPKGWKINEIIPLHSPAMSGGGVSDNMFRDMMAQMQAEGGGAQLPPGMANMAGALGGTPSTGGEPKKKDKKDKKKGKA